jgi:hypothetical protein
MVTDTEPVLVPAGKFTVWVVKFPMSAALPDLRTTEAEKPVTGEVGLYTNESVALPDASETEPLVGENFTSVSKMALQAFMV